jgi:hypothetical protein
MKNLNELNKDMAFSVLPYVTLLILSVILLLAVCSVDATLRTPPDPMTYVYIGNTPPSSYVNKESYGSSNRIFSLPTSDEFDTKWVGNKQKYHGEIGVVRELLARGGVDYVALTWRQPYGTPAVCFWVQYMRVPIEDLYRVDDVRPSAIFDRDWTLLSVTVGTSTIIDGLSPGEAYLFRVGARNFSGDGDFSENIGVIVAE